MAKTIIEKEIERRESLIVKKFDNEARVSELQTEIEKIKVENEGICVSILEVEIEELKSYLPKLESEVADSVVEAPMSAFGNPSYGG